MRAWPPGVTTILRQRMGPLEATQVPPVGFVMSMARPPVIRPNASNAMLDSVDGVIA